MISSNLYFNYDQMSMGYSILLPEFNSFKNVAVISLRILHLLHDEIVFEIFKKEKAENSLKFLFPLTCHATTNLAT